MTLHRHWPEVEKMLVMVDSFKRRGHYGTPTPTSAAALLIEWDKIQPYKAKGFIADWPAGQTRHR